VSPIRARILLGDKNGEQAAGESLAFREFLDNAVDEAVEDLVDRNAPLFGLVCRRPDFP
jgi:hypothetical protein